MSHLPTLISDLALILVCAGLMTLLFKKLKQPLVLGYVVAGFLASPHMPYTPSVMDTANIQTWADLGVVFLLFALGLDFSLKKIAKVGGAAPEAVEPGQYSMQGNTYLGVKNGMFYVSSKQPVLSMTKPKEAVDASRFEGNLLCGELNVKGLMANPLLQSMTQANSNARMAAPLLKEIDKLDYVVVDRDKVELRLQLEKADKNPLQLLVEEACKL